MDALYYVLTLISGISWTIVYLAIIYRGFKDRTFGMPFFALALNLTWEFLYSFLFGGEISLQLVINVIWFAFDLVILYTYFRYGRSEFPSSVDPKWFVPWSILALAVGFVTQYFTCPGRKRPSVQGSGASAALIHSGDSPDSAYALRFIPPGPWPLS